MCEFLTGQERRCQRLWCQKIQSISKKEKFLMQKKHKDIVNNLKPICYSCYVPSGSDPVLLARQHSTITNQSVKINIKPDYFDLHSNIEDPHEKWFINLSGTNIPKNVQTLLQLGDRFNLPITNSRPIKFEFIKSIERNIDMCPENLQWSIRNGAISIIQNLRLKLDYNDKFLLNSLKQTRKFLVEHPDILITKADKGNTIVALNKIDYILKVEQMLSDTNTYLVVKKDPTKKLTDDLHTLLSRWKNKNYIDVKTYRSLMTSDGILPRAYGLPKIHKQNCPFRIIVSSINSPLYMIAQFLHNILKKSLVNPDSYITNSHELVNKLKGFQLDSDYNLGSLDVVSLFTNVPTDEAYNSINKRWDVISKKYNNIKNRIFVSYKTGTQFHLLHF